MSSTADVATAGQSRAESQRGLWGRQVAAIMRLELRKNFLGKRAALIYLLAALPLLLVVAMVSISGPDTPRQALSIPGRGSLVYSYLYGALVLRTVVFFGCAWIFMNLFRGDIVDRSLHYYFLAAVRRDVLVVGKYLTGLLTSVVLFGGVTLATALLIHLPLGFSGAVDHLLNGSGLSQALAYTGITVLACVGYGAVFLAIGLVFRNPIIPALALYGWEWINFLLPPLLKKASVIHYVHSLVPVPVSEGPFAILVEPTPAWIGIPSLLVGAALLLALASLQARRMEIRYASE